MNITYTDKITVEAYNNLWKSAGWSERSQEQNAIGLSNSIVFVAEHEGVPVGITRIITDGGFFALIVDVIVHPNYQGNGIGKTLVQKALDYLKGKLPTNWEIYVCLMSVKGKEGFYEKLGFTKRPNDDLGSGMSLIYKNKGDSK